MFKKINVLFMFLVLLCGMTAFAADRDTPERTGQFVQLTAGAAIAKGEMVAMLSSDAKAYPAADTASYAVLGRAEKAAAIGESVLVKRGTFRWTNGGSFTVADIGKLAYVKDATAIWKAASATNDIPAGRVIDVDSYGVWVDTYNQDVLLTATVGNLTATGTADVTGNTTVGGTLTVTGASQPKTLATVELTATTLTVTSAYYGKIIFVNTNDTVAVTLPANGAAAGSWFDMIIVGSDACAPTVSAATADTLITVNDAAADSVTFGTGHRIGAHVRFISNGTKWIAVNVGSTTMTVNT